jgi:hypothetical protein
MTSKDKVVIEKSLSQGSLHNAICKASVVLYEGNRRYPGRSGLVLP